MAELELVVQTQVANREGVLGVWLSNAQWAKYEAEITLLRAEVAKWHANYEEMRDRLGNEADRLAAEVARLTREIVEIERFRAAPLNTIRKLLGDHESPDEAIAGSVCAVLVTRQETVRRKQAAEKECDALRARVTQLVGALEAVSDTRQFGACWCATIERTHCVGQAACKEARTALAAAEKLLGPAA